MREVILPAAAAVVLAATLSACGGHDKERRCGLAGLAGIDAPVYRSVPPGAGSRAVIIRLAETIRSRRAGGRGLLLTLPSHGAEHDSRARPAASGEKPERPNPEASAVPARRKVS